MTEGIGLPGGFRMSEYEIVRELGEGGFGITYLGYDHHLDKPVAIKEYLPAELAARGAGHTVVPRSAQRKADFSWGLGQFIEEARILARFQHASLIGVHRFFEAHGTAYIVMEYAEGETLSALLRRENRLDEQALRSIALPIMEGLEKVHAAKVLHRDIKPANIVVRNDGTPVLIDFGAARQAIGMRSRSVTSIVTPGFAPIEQYSTKGEQGPWTDIYALGAVCYRALIGRDPDDATDRVRHDPLIAATVAGRGLASDPVLKAIDWALAVDAGDRPQTVAQWRAAFDSNAGAVAKKNAGRVEPSSIASGPVEPRRSRLPLAVAAAALLVAVAAGVYVFAGADAIVSSPEARTSALSLQAEVHAILEQVDGTDDRIEAEIAALESQIQALEGTTGRTEAERNDIANAIVERRSQVAALREQLPLVRALVDAAPSVVRLRGQLAVAEADVRDRSYESAARSLNGIRAEVERVQQAVAAIPGALRARAGYERTRQRALGLVGSGGIAALPRWNNVGELGAAGEKSLGDGDFAGAAWSFESARLLAVVSAREAIDARVASLKATAEQAMTAADLPTAREAIDVARRLSTLRNEFAP